MTVRNNPVVFASMSLAILSLLIFPPSIHTLDLINFDVILILFTLMVAVAGMSRCDMFSMVAERMISFGNTARGICAILVFLTFFSSMLITNDVALITFVPLSIAVLSGAGRRDLLIPVLVLQTVAANLGSCLTPIGNPQNLFIFSYYSPTLSDFIITMVPITITGATLILSGILISCKGGISHDVSGGRRVERKGLLLTMVIVFSCGVSSVAGVLPAWASAAIAVASMAVMDRKLFVSIDYGLLLTFLFLFVFTGNIARIPEVSVHLSELMSMDPVLASAGASQVISNVPAALMLSQFTMDWQGLLMGVSIGGLGTPIASMASLITIGIYSKTKDNDSKGFMKIFLMANFGLLAFLLSIQKLFF